MGVTDEAFDHAGTASGTRAATWRICVRQTVIRQSACLVLLLGAGSSRSEDGNNSANETVLTVVASTPVKYGSNAMDVSTLAFILFLLLFALDVGLIIEALYDLANTQWEPHMKFMWIVVI